MLSTTLNMPSRSLCASIAAYGIDPTGTFTPSNPYYSAIGYLAPPVTFVAGDDDIDACLVGTTDQGVVLAFRGTIPPNIHDQQSVLDWMGDLTDNPIVAPGIPGKVHAGFWQGLSALWEPMVKEIKQQMTAGGKSLPLYITGHSKGGALSSLAALRLKLEAGIAPIAVYTFASPHPGDTTFANQYRWVIPNHIRYEYGNDIVPHNERTKLAQPSCFANPECPIWFLCNERRVFLDDETIRSDSSHIGTYENFGTIAISLHLGYQST